MLPSSTVCWSMPVRKPDSFRGQRGYLAFVQNSQQVDYLSLALLQAKSIKQTQSINQYAVAVDAATKALITDHHLEYFDHVVDIPWGDDSAGHDWKLANDWKAWWITPFKETVKLDCDILFTRDVSHWWDVMCRQEVFISTSVYDYTGTIATSRRYRKLFDDNGLIDAYNGFTYFRYGKDSMMFYQHVKTIFKNWPVYRDLVLKNCRYEHPVTDEVYAIAAQIMGPERCHIPGTGIGFVHMKGAINGFGTNDDWTTRLYHQLDGSRFTIGHYAQQYPVHYVNKQLGLELLAQYGN
jgi:hypothetical protein